MKRQGLAVNKGKNKKQKRPALPPPSPRVMDAGTISALVTTKLAEQPVPIWVQIFNTYFTNEDLINIVCVPRNNFTVLCTSIPEWYARLHL